MFYIDIVLYRAYLRAPSKITSRSREFLLMSCLLLLPLFIVLSESNKRQNTPNLIQNPSELLTMPTTTTTTTRLSMLLSGISDLDLCRRRVTTHEMLLKIMSGSSSCGRTRRRRQNVHMLRDVRRTRPFAALLFTVRIPNRIRLLVLDSTTGMLLLLLL